MKKRILSVLVVLVTLILNLPLVLAENSIEIVLTIGNTHMYVNGSKQEIDPGNNTSPIITDGRTLLPVRAIIEAFGGKIDWDGNQRMVTIANDGTEILLWIDKTNTKVNGIDTKIDVPPVIINGRTMLPIRFISENLGCKVEWNQDTREVTITKSVASSNGQHSPISDKEDLPNGTATILDTVTIISDIKEPLESYIEDVTYTDNGDMKVTFGKNVPNEISSLNKGEIFLIEPSEKCPEGYMAKIVSIKKEGDKLVVVLSQPSFEEVFEEIDFESNADLNVSNITACNFREGAELTIGDSENAQTIIAAGPQFRLGDLIDSITTNYEEDKEKNKRLKRKVVEEFSISFNSVIFDKDGDISSENDQVKLQGKLTVKDASTESVIKFKKSEFPQIEQLKSRFIATLESDIAINYYYEGQLGIDDLLLKDKNNIKLGSLAIEGLEREAGKVVLGSINFDIGTMTITPQIGNKKMLTTVGASILFTMTIGGAIEAEVSIGAGYGCFIDQGFDIKSVGETIQVETFDVFADRICPNPNSEGREATEKEKNTKPALEWFIDGQVDVSAQQTFGVDCAVYFLGVVPAKITNDVGLFQEFSAHGRFSNTEMSGQIEGKISFGARINLIARIALGFGKQTEHEYSSKLLEKEFWRFPTSTPTPTQTPTLTPTPKQTSTITLMSTSNIDTSVFEDNNYWVGLKKDKGKSFYDVAWNGKVYVAVGRDRETHDGISATSTDGITWEIHKMPERSKNIVFYKGKFIATTMATWGVLTSLDGKAWEVAGKDDNGITLDGDELGFIGLSIEQIAVVDDKCYIVGYRDEAYVSTDGKAWTTITVNKPAEIDWGRISYFTYNNGIYIAVLDKVDYQIIYSDDGVNWKTAVIENIKIERRVVTGETGNIGLVKKEIPHNLGDDISISYYNGKFIVTDNDPCIFTSPDGVNWTFVDPVETFVDPVLYPQKGSLSEVLISNGSDKLLALVNNKYIYASYDGNEWSKIGDISDIFDDFASKIVYINNKLIILGNGIFVCELAKK